MIFEDTIFNLLKTANDNGGRKLLIWMILFSQNSFKLNCILLSFFKWQVLCVGMTVISLEKVNAILRKISK